MDEHLDVKLVLETNDVRDVERWCELLSRHGVGTVQQLSAWTGNRLIECAREWGIDDYYVRYYALPKAQKLTQELVTSPQNLATIRQELLVRARMH